METRGPWKSKNAPPGPQHDPRGEHHSDHLPSGSPEKGLAGPEMGCFYRWAGCFVAAFGGGMVIYGLYLVLGLVTGKLKPGNPDTAPDLWVQAIEEHAVVEEGGDEGRSFFSGSKARSAHRWQRGHHLRVHGLVWMQEMK